MKIEVKEEDEYPHSPLKDALWWENYHFNGYDPARKVGVTIEVSVKPVLGIREEMVSIHGENPLFFRDEKILGDDAFTSGSVKMEPLQLLRKWRVRMKDSFARTERGIPSNKSESVEFDLFFESDVPPYGFRTERGDRYEQPSSLKGEICIGDTAAEIVGKGIRDHSWEVRYIPSWGAWYALMGYLNPGFISLAYITVGEKPFCQGWVRRDKYYEIQTVQVSHAASDDVVKECHFEVDTSEEKLEIDSRLLSFVEIPMGEEQKKSTVMETLVNIDKGGYGILWYGKPVDRV